MADFNYLKEDLKRLEGENLLRKLTVIESAQGPRVKIDGRSFVLFASNNYLNLANDPEIIAAAKAAVEKYGWGAGASRLISGTMSVHIETEDKLAKFTGKEAGLIFPSGWMANEAVIKTLPGKNDLLILDKLNHASIIDAARASGAVFRTFRRDRTDRLEKLLGDENYDRKFIITESVFSMDGDRADLKKLAELKNRYDAYLVVDEAHAFGCFGENGAGLADEQGVLEDVDIFIATFSKAFAGNGGFVAGGGEVIDYLINCARAFIYTTAPSPVNAAVICKALEMVIEGNHRREALKSNSMYLKSALEKLGFDTGQSSSHIIPVIIGSEQETLKMSAMLEENGFYIPAIRPPTVAAGTCRLRISVQSGHRKEQLDRLISVLKEYKKDCNPEGSKFLR